MEEFLLISRKYGPKSNFYGCTTYIFYRVNMLNVAKKVIVKH